MNTEIPVTILTGFLGTGKTTLLNRLLRAEHGRRLGVLVNDFGAINIDARLVDALEGDAVSLTNGCVCCSMRGDLVTNALRILDRSPPPEHLIVEASGIADPISIAGAFQTSRLRERTRLDGIITVVDGENARNPHLDQQLIQDQIRSADIILLNKIDLVSSATRDEVSAWIRSLAPWARIVETVQAEAPLDVLLGSAPGPGAAHCAGRGDVLSDGAGTAAHASTFASWSYHTDQPLAYRRVREALESLPPAIYRVKGILALADAPNLRFVVQGVGRRVTIDVLGPWGEEPRETALVWIGTPGAAIAEDLVRTLDACRTPSVALIPYHSFQDLKRARSLPSRVAPLTHKL